MLGTDGVSPNPHISPSKPEKLCIEIGPDETYEAEVISDKSPFIDTQFDQKNAKIRNLILPNRKPPMEYIKEYFQDSSLIPDWFIEIGNATEHTSIQTGNYQNPYCCNMDIIREYFLSTTHFYRDDYIHNPFTWCPLGIKNGIKNYSIYYITVNVIDFVEQLLKIVNRLPSFIVQNLREIQDRFQCLSMYMELESIFKDNELTRRQRNSIVLSPIEFYGPRRDVTFTMRNLPDLYIHVLYCNFTGNSDHNPFKEEYHQSIIRLLAKSLPYACKSRSLPTIIPGIWTNDPVNNPNSTDQKRKREQSTTPNKRRKSTVVRTKKVQPSVTYNRNSSSNRKQENFEGFFDIISRFIFASLLGVYDHCTVIPTFQVRRKLYANFMMNSVNSGSLEKWVRDNGKLCTYVIREYLYFCTESLSGLTEYMRKNYFWDIMKDNTYSATNSVREFMNESLDNFMFTHDKFVQFGNEFCSVMEQYDNEYVYFDQCKPLDPTITFEPNRPWHKEMSGTLNRYNKENLERAPRIMEMPFVDKVFNVIRTLNDECYIEECKDVDRIVPPAITNLVKTIIEAIIKEGYINDISFDFLVLHPINMLPSSLLRLNRGYRLYSKEESRSKIKTIMKAIHSTSQYDYHLLSLFFQVLKDKKSFSIVSTPGCMQRRLLNTLHRIYETKQGQKLPPGAGIYYVCEACKQIKTNVYPYSNERDRYRPSSLCATDTCLDLSTGKVYCAKIASKSNPKNRETSSDTISHVFYDAKKKEKAKKKEARHQRKMEMINNCPNQELTMVDMKCNMIITEAGTFLLCPECAVMTELSKNDFDNETGRFSCGCVNYDKQTKIQCKLCPKKTNNPVYYKVYDDSNPDAPQLHYVPFCPTHKLAWIDKFPDILTLSTISHSLSDNLKSVQLADGSRIFTETSFTKTKRKLRRKY